MQQTGVDWYRVGISFLLCAIVCWLGWSYLRRKYSELPFWQSMLDPWALCFWLLAVGIAPIAVRHGLPKEVITAVLAAVLFGSLLRMSYRMRGDLPDHGRAHPGGIALDGQRDGILISPKERRLAAIFQRALMVLIIGCALLFGLVLSLSAPSYDGRPASYFTVVAASSAAAAGLIGFRYVMFCRWPGTVRWTANIEIFAAPETIWEALVLRDDYSGWKKIYTNIERLQGAREVYRLRHATDQTCRRCGRAFDPDRSTWSSTVEVIEARKPSTYRIRTVLNGVFPHDKKDARTTFDYEENAFHLSAQSNGGTIVVFRGALVRPKAWLALLIFRGGPAKETLQSLKSHIEGADDNSISGVAAKRIEAARKALKNCECPSN